MQSKSKAVLRQIQPQTPSLLGMQGDKVWDLARLPSFTSLWRERCLTVVKEEVPSAPFASDDRYCHTQQEDRGIEQRKHNTVQDGGQVGSTESW